MKIVKILFAAFGLSFGLCLAGCVVAGIMIPAEQSFSNEIEINAPAEEVWQVVTDKNKYTEWQTNLTKVEVADDKSWVEYPKDSPQPLKFTLAKDERPSRMAFDYKMGDTFDGKWLGDVTPTATGVRLKTVDSYAAKDWVTKILMYVFFDYDTFAKDWNAKLKARVEKLN